MIAAIAYSTACVAEAKSARMNNGIVETFPPPWSWAI